MVATTDSDPQSGSAVAAPILDSLSPQDRDKLSLLFRTHGDAVSFATLREEDPLETLLWLNEPHIKPWHDAIRAAHREHEQTETRLSLARALRDITRILDLEADSTLRIRAANAIIKLANAINRANSAASSSPLRLGGSAGEGLANRITPQSRTRPTNSDRTTTPSPPSTLRNPAPSSPLRGVSDGCQGSRGSASAPLVAALENLQHPGGVREPLDNISPSLTEGAAELPAAETGDEPFAIIRVMRGNIENLEPAKALNGAHTLTARAGTARPPPERRRSRKRRR